MKNIFWSAILGLIFNQYFALGQEAPDKYIEFVYGERGNKAKNYKTNLVIGDILVSPKKPLIIKTPNETELFNIYTFNLIFETKNYKAFILPLDDPFKPKLVTTDNDSTQLDELQLIGNVEEPRPDYEAIEEVKIASETDITLTTKISTWTLDEKGQRIKNSMKVVTTISKYRITEKGTIVKNRD